MAKKKAENGWSFGEPASMLTDSEKDDLVIHLLRCPGFFEEAIEKLDQTVLNACAVDRLGMIGSMCREIYREFKLTPADRSFARRLKRGIRAREEQSGGEFLLGEDLPGIEDFVDRASQTDPAELSLQKGRALLKQLLFEVQVVGPLHQNFLGSSRNYPADVRGALNEFSERARAIEGFGATPVKTLGEEWDEHEARLKQFRGRTTVGLKTGLPELDRRTLGLRGVFVFGAKPGIGKSTYSCVEIALGVCRHSADNDAVVVILSLDMDRYDLYRRIHSNLGDLDWNVLMFGSPAKSRAKNSSFSKAHKECLKEADRRLEDEEVRTRLAILDREALGDDITAMRLTSILKDLKARTGASRVLLIVDYLQLLPVPEDVANRGDLAADKYRVRMVQQVVEQARTAGDPVGDTALLISEARKPATSKQPWGDSMSEVMGSARLVYAGDAVLLCREMTANEMKQYYGFRAEQKLTERREALKEQGIVPVMFILDKGRDGMVRGKWGAEFHFNKSKFIELKPGLKCMPAASGARNSKQPGNGRPPLPPVKPSGKSKKKS